MFDLALAGILLVLVGLGVMVVATLSRWGKDGADVKGGGVILIGPVPIIFGSDMKWASVAIILAIILIVLTVVLGLI